MGSDYNTSGAQNPQAVLNAYARYLPSLTQLAAGEGPNTALQQLLASNQFVNPSNPSAIAQQQLQAAQQQMHSAMQSGSANQIRAAQTAMDQANRAVSMSAGQGTPMGINQLNLDQMQRYALPEAQVGQDVARSNALAGAETNRQQIEGPGGDAALSATLLNRALNPAYYQAQDAASRGAAAGVNAINLNGLSPGEASSVERSLNQTNTATGNLGLVNPTNTISNAINFGGAFNSKLGLMNNAVNTATGAANSAANSGVNPVNIALGQPNQSTAGNFGTGQFSNTNANTGASASGNAFNFSSGLLGNMTSGNSAAQTAGASMGNATSPAAYLGAVCCFIFLEAYHGRLPKCVRKGRDKYYYKNPDIATGYRRMAKWLVPLMKENEFIRRFVWVLMVNPITVHLYHPKNNINKRVCHFWLRVWAILGKNKAETDYHMMMEYSRV